VSLAITPVDPILIKSGYATIDGPDMVPVVTHRNGEQTYYFPGTSLKGVLRSHLERIARSLVPGSVCVPYCNPDKKDHRPDRLIPVASEQQCIGCSYKGGEDAKKWSTAETYRNQCAVCRMFGSLRFAGRFSIGDAYPKPDSPPVIESRNGVGIDRFTGGTVRGVLFDLKAVVGGCFEATLRLVNFEVWQLAALQILLTDLQDGLISIGSGRSRAMGGIRAEVERFELSYLRPTSHVVGLDALVSPEESKAYGLFVWQSPQEIPLPESTRAGLRQQCSLNERWKDMAVLTPTVEDFLNWQQWPTCPVHGIAS
jgi:CRISPR-associated RAMP protein (TIGR02581 family)